MDTDTRRAHARAYLAVRTVVREPYIDERGRACQRWVETSHYSYDYMTEDGTMTYFAWHDLDPKKSDAAKLAAAIARYVERFGAPPATVLTHAERFEIAPGQLWLGPVEER